MDSSNINRPPSPNPSVTSNDSGIAADLTTETDGGRSISSFSPSESSLRGMKHTENLPAKKITDRTPSYLTNKQKLKLGLMKLVSHFISGKKTRNWLASKALKLMDTAVTSGHRTLAVQLNEFITKKLFPLNEKQSAEYNRLSNQYTSAMIEDLQVAESDFPDPDHDEDQVPFNSEGRLFFIGEDSGPLTSRPEKEE